LAGCSDKQVTDVVEAISDAIDIGAPLYNRGDIEACFRIYEGTSSKLERDPPCKGIGKAFGDGLLRASTLATYKEKAWALRDTFDGLIDVAKRRGARPNAGKTTP
ncbi:MAG: serine protease, partial [Deltaproteobacteria bacterium]|nr:serine protease [Deltaproteobacteria bacterium]